MHFLLIVLFCAGLIRCVYSNVVPTGDNEKLCPPPEKIAPCICFKVLRTQRVTVRCSNFTNAYEIKAIFDRNSGWKVQDVWIDESTMSFLPANMLEEAHFQSLNVSSTSLVTLFDTTPVKTPELRIYLFDVKLLRGFDWRSIAKTTLLELKIVNMRIKSLGQDFKESIPKGVQRLSFENTGVTSIKDQPFTHLQKLKFLVLRGGSLKKVSRDMFPRPWNVKYLDLSYQKIAALPEDIFVDLPIITFFLVEGNLLTTISEKVFTNYQVFYLFQGNPLNCDCNVKWILGKIDLTYLYGVCTEPESLKGTELRYLKEDYFRYCH